MALVSFKDLCIDAVDPVRLGAFWARTLGLQAQPLEDGDVKLVGTQPGQTVWVNGVPEAKTVKQRVHLDVFGHSLDEFAGAPRLSKEGEFPWTVIADPEGGELCVFVRHEVPAYRLKDVVVDAANPAAIADWWGAMLGGAVVHDGDYSYLDEVPGVPFDDIDFVPVPEAKAVKNRIHWDVTLLPGRTLDDVLATGARLLHARDEDIGWHVLADPDGNEFCVFAPA